jgi:chromosome transmission fidelity protein 1
VTSIRDFHPTLQGTSIPQDIPQKRGHEDLEEGEDSIVTPSVALGSRKQLCINEKLRSKAWDLDEVCRELLGGLLF